MLNHQMRKGRGKRIVLGEGYVPGIKVIAGMEFPTKSQPSSHKEYHITLWHKEKKSDGPKYRLILVPASDSPRGRKKP